MYQQKQLRLFTLIMISLTAVFSINHISVMATIGAQSIVFLGGAAILFFIPSALVSAELGGMMTSNNGGLYTWVSRAFGQNAGLVAIWMEWFNNVIGYPATLAGTIATFAYLGFPNLTNNHNILFVAMVILFWGISFFNCLSIGKVTILNIVGGLFGMLLPGVILIVCGIYGFFYMPNNLQISNSSDWIPALNFATFALFVKTLNSYSGIQSAAFHTRNVRNAKRNIPLSMTITVVIIFSVVTLATLSLSSIVPQDQLNVMSGMIQGISIVLNKVNLGYLAPIITICICVGIVTQTSTWVLGPARAMQEVAADGLVPKYLARKNNSGMPVAVLMTQGIIGSFLSLVFLFLPTIQEAFAMIIALTAQFSVMMWVMIFVSAIKLRYSEPESERPFRVGGKSNFLLILCASFGIISCACGFFLGLFPPKFSLVQNPASYCLLMIIADVIIIIVPFLYIWFKKKSVTNKAAVVNKI